MCDKTTKPQSINDNEYIHLFTEYVTSAGYKEYKNKFMSFDNSLTQLKELLDTMHEEYSAVSPKKQIVIKNKNNSIALIKVQIGMILKERGPYMKQILKNRKKEEERRARGSDIPRHEHQTVTVGSYRPLGRLPLNLQRGLGRK